MKLARVIGRVVPSKIYKGLEGVPLLLIRPVAPDGSESGNSVVAADATRMAGPGELVSYEGGREAALALDPWFVPVDHAIVGIVDAVELKHLDRLQKTAEG
ncbi:MAG: ethanolamine utilization protein EutN [Verrucomicrobia bacterium]|nr:MAG: ethanolamine utilization protein EutN [Verrucomicrobiota bacterium]